jgi:mannosyltransferase OCH1-like enzyme
MNKVIRDNLIKSKWAIKALINHELPVKNLKKHVIKFENFHEIDNFIDQKNYFFSWKTSWLTKSHYEDILTLIQRNRDFNFILFDDKSQDKWMFEFGRRIDSSIYRIYKACIFSATKSDIFRLLLLKSYGGIFSGINMTCDKPLNSLFSKTEFVCTFEKNKLSLNEYSELYPDKFKGHYLVQHTLMSPRNHKLLDVAISKIKKNANFYNNKVFKHTPTALWNFSAPGMLTHALNEYLDAYGKVDISFAGFEYHNSYRYANGHKYRYMFSPSYHGVRNSKILRLEATI